MSVRRSFGLVVVLWGALAVGGWTMCGARESTESVLGTTVLSVELRSDTTIERPEELWDLVGMAAGQPLTRRAMRRTLLDLQASGVVGETEIRLVPGSSGVRVVVMVRPKLLVTEIAIDGELCVRRSRLEARLQQQPSTPLSESRVIRGVYRLQDLLIEQGYRSAGVRLDVDVDRAKREARVSYLVECGAPTVVGKVVFDGALGPHSTQELTERLAVTDGRPLRQDRLRGEGGRLQEWLIGQGHRLARVEGPREVVAGESGVVDLAYEIELGPRFEIVVKGDEDLLRRKNVLELLYKERFDEALLDHVKSRIERFYQERGYFAVDVRSTTSAGGDRVLVEIAVRQGPQLTVEGVTFRGNEVVTSEDLRRRMTTGPPRAFGASGFLVTEQLEDDLSNLRAYYARRGFPFAVVGPVEVRRENLALSVEIPIVEGQQERVVDLTFVGIEDQEVQALTSELSLAAGGPFHVRLLEESLDEIRAAYEDAGYLSAQVEGTVTSDPESPLRRVEIRVLEGPRVRVARVVLRGNARTRSAAVRKSLELDAGDIVSRRALLDAQRRLYRLGIFSRAEVSLAPAMPFASERDVIVRVEEGRSQRVTFGLGYDSEDGVRTLLGYSHANLAGRALSTRVDVRVSEREEQFRALLRQPFLGRRSVPVTYSLFAVEEAQESFDSKRRGVQVEAHRQRGGTRLGLLYTYKRVDVLEREGEPLFELGIDRNLQESEIASLTPSLFLDRRDDPVVPTSGWTLNLQAESAFSLFSARSEYVKLFGQGTLHRRLAGVGVLAGSLRLGAIEPFGVDSADTASLVPISEQFFAGGRTTHRSYDRDLLGVLGQAVLLCERTTDACVGELPSGAEVADYRRIAVGGNALLVANLDLRFPIVEPLGGTLFVDVGNVWAEWGDVDPSELKVGAGVGLRYLSPIGPLRLEVGWKLDPEPGESTSVVFLSFGNPF